MPIAICLWIVSVLFGVLSAVAAVHQMKTEKEPFPALWMLAGSALLIAAVLCGIGKQSYDVLLALLGCAGICAAAIRNGLKSGSFHIQHHIIRITLSLLLIIGFFLF